MKTIEEIVKRIEELIIKYDDMKETSITVKDWKMRDYYNGCVSSLTNLKRELKNIQKE